MPVYELDGGGEKGSLISELSFLLLPNCQQ